MRVSRRPVVPPPLVERHSEPLFRWQHAPVKGSIPSRVEGYGSSAVEHGTSLRNWPKKLIASKNDQRRDDGGSSGGPDMALVVMRGAAVVTRLAVLRIPRRYVPVLVLMTAPARSGLKETGPYAA